MADPLVLDLIDEFPGNAREDRLLPVLVDRVALSLCGDNHQVNVGPVQTELGGMGAIDLDLALRHDPMDHFSDLSDEELFDQVHLLQDVLHAVSEGKHLIMQLVIELRRVALARWVEHFISLNHLDEIVVLAGRKAEIVPLHAAVALLQGGAWEASSELLTQPVLVENVLLQVLIDLLIILLDLFDLALTERFFFIRFVLDELGELLFFVDELDDECLKLDFLLVLAAFEDFKFLLGFFVEFEELSVFHLHLSVLLEEALVGVVVVHGLLVLDLVVDGIPLVAQVQDLVLQIHPQALLLLHLLVPGLQLPLSPVEVLLQNEDPLVLLTPQLDVLDEVLVVLLAAFPMTHVLPIVPPKSSTSSSGDTEAPSWEGPAAQEADSAAAP
eukprot:CAMPEP_0170567756 /NCGR_PEP_ID=MMETSP0211-20121228/80691_1 /TAXON_ID=311385 /ORGANISM="Pseudokeronopsis sp., Strain OXSARD2" /LENGTH=384 /DNA_ID=CAMNT_0010889315 /DNA_START=800 /DNA_END=1953 /DNA_ORIENTATION=-